MKTIKLVEPTGSAASERGHRPKSGLAAVDIIEGPDNWILANAIREASESGASWAFDHVPLNVQALSPAFALEKGKLYIFQLEANVSHAAPFALVLVAEGASPSHARSWLRWRAMEKTGHALLGFSFTPEEPGRFQLALINYFGAYNKGAALTFPSFAVLESPHLQDIEIGETNTYLAHWGAIKRLIHRLCKRSRMFNAFVAGIEMRLGREESLSLPMYLAFCPTGQCNALCDFCSVTIKRTGIIKKQLPFDKLQHFLQPTLNTAFMYGVEGNGEPTIYREFNSLLATLQKRGAASYLITNGALIEPEQIPHLLTLQSITFSLNAATAETHRKVMKLREFEGITNTIRAIVEQRGIDDKPCVYVSFVVHGTNAHELQQFLEFAEYELRVNVIMIRPLSELGADSGAVEDLREIVPYECQVRDALDAAREYLEDIPRRHIPYTRFHCEIVLDPTTFRSVRPDPVDCVIMPPGFDDRLLAPRRDNWHVSDPKISIAWKLNQVTIHCPTEVNPGVVWRSDSTPVIPGKHLTFMLKIRLEGSPIKLTVVAPEREPLGSMAIQPSTTTQEVVLNFDTGCATRVALEFSHEGGGFVAEMDFIRLLTPGAGIRKEFKLPFPRRWQIDTPGIKAQWRGNVVSISAGPNLSGRYLFKSYSNPCTSGARLKLPVCVDVQSGVLVIGVLSEDFQKWTHQFAFEMGSHKRELDIETGSNRRLQVVIFARGNAPLVARIDWGDTLEAPPDRERGEAGEDFEVPGLESNTAEVMGPSAHKTAGASVFFRAKSSKRERVRFYCQKPWTDINNFTVDGRMDVCCIATGASQEHYALGNILEQDFQDIWNGKQMREFRRTVNSDKPLPPCQRCPMAYGYQGPFFDPNLIDAVLEKIFVANMAEKSRIWRIGGLMVFCVVKPFAGLFFSGFKRR